MLSLPLFFSKAQLFSREWEVLIEPSVRVILSLDRLQSGNVLSIDGLQRFVAVGKVDVPVVERVSMWFPHKIDGIAIRGEKPNSRLIGR